MKKKLEEIVYTKKELKIQKRKYLRVLEYNGLFLERIPEILKRDRLVVHIAVEQNGMALEFAPELLKNDKILVKVAIHNDPGALEFASIHLKDDK